jgi:hypothetical protein
VTQEISEDRFLFRRAADDFLSKKNGYYPTTVTQEISEDRFLFRRAAEDFLSKKNGYYPTKDKSIYGLRD